jgi:hypothetical protein
LVHARSHPGACYDWNVGLDGRTRNEVGADGERISAGGVLATVDGEVHTFLSPIEAL